MKRLNPEKLSVEYRQGVDAKEPVFGRKYTLTHSDETAELYLTIGKKFAWDKVNDLRDEVLGKWSKKKQDIIFKASCYVNGEEGEESAAIRYAIFARELPLALEAIRYGDRELFETYKELDQVPIWIHFQSQYDEYDRLEYWGKFEDYK